MAGERERTQFHLGALVLLTLTVSCGRTAIFEGRRMPIAVIVPAELSGAVGQDLLVSGASSEDPEGEPLSFEWRIASRPPAGNAQLDALTTVEARLQPDRPGAWFISLVVSAGDRRSSPTLALMTVRPAPGALVANAGPDRRGRPGVPIPLDGTGSFDADGLPLTFLWSIASQPMGSAARIPSPALPAPLLQAALPGRYEVRLTVSAGGRSASDSMVATIVAFNNAPIANAGPVQSVALGSPVRLDGSGSSDPDGDPLTFSWRTLAAPAAVMLTNPTSVSPSFTPPLAGLYELELEVMDDQGASALDRTRVEVAGPVDAGSDAGIDAGVDAGIRDAGPGIDGGDLLDPREVYIAGTLEEGACWLYALAHWSTPNVASTGFETCIEGATLRSDGRLLYFMRVEHAVREFHCDTCPYQGTFPFNNYPFSTAANDPIVLPTPCTGLDDSMTRFRVSSEGRLFYECFLSTSFWRDESGAIAFDAGTDPTAPWFGRSGWVLSPTLVTNLQTGATNPVTGVPLAVWLAARWSEPDGFLLAADLGGTTQLWRVATSGVGQLVGTYPPPPSLAVFYQTSPHLDGAGRLFEIGIQLPGGNDIIVRRQAGSAAADVVYTEATNPLVKLHASSLVTGP